MFSSVHFVYYNICFLTITKLQNISSNLIIRNREIKKSLFIVICRITYKNKSQILIQVSGYLLNIWLLLLKSYSTNSF